MAFARFLVIFSIVVGVISTSALAEQHIVGDGAGWRVGFDYTTWAQGRTFSVGDTLVFNYNVGEHNVHNVTGPDFQTCTVSANSVGWTTGHDVITLKTIGKKWYICSFPEHCIDGQKLVINVMEAGSPAPAPTPTSSNGFKSMTTSVSNLFMVIMAAMTTFFMI